MPQIRFPEIETLSSHIRREAWRCDAARSIGRPMVFWIARGQGRFMLDCRTYGIGANSLIYIPPQTLFSYEMANTTQGMVLTLPQENEVLPTEPAVLKAIPMPAQRELNGLIEAMIRESGAQDLGAAHAVSAHLMLFGVLLQRLVDAAPAQRKRKADSLLSRFSHILSIQHKTGKNLSDFAADLEVTPTHLTRLTRDAAGKPASLLLQERVIHAACDALLSTNASIKDIAADLGFGSAAYFTRAFQNHTGRSPSAYRKERRGTP